MKLNPSSTAKLPQLGAGTLRHSAISSRNAIRIWRWSSRGQTIREGGGRGRGRGFLCA